MIVRNMKLVTELEKRLEALKNKPADPLVLRALPRTLERIQQLQQTVRQGTTLP